MVDVDARYLNWTYRPELADSDDPDETWESVLELVEGSVDVAIRIIDLCEWQHPSTILDEEMRYGEIRETKDGYELCDPNDEEESDVY